MSLGSCGGVVVWQYGTACLHDKAKHFFPESSFGRHTLYAIEWILFAQRTVLTGCLMISIISRHVIEGTLCLPASSASSLAICNNSTTAARSSNLEWTHYTLAPLPTQRQEVFPLKQKAHRQLLPAHPQHPTSSGKHQHPLAQQQPCYAPGSQTRSHSTGWSCWNCGWM
jgi:hypothetical protein